LARKLLIRRHFRIKHHTYTRKEMARCSFLPGYFFGEDKNIVSLTFQEQVDHNLIRIVKPQKAHKSQNNQTLIFTKHITDFVIIFFDSTTFFIMCVL